MQKEKRKIWAHGSVSTILGRVEHPIATEVEVINERQIGKGLSAFSCRTSTGKKFVALSINGKIVGKTFSSATNRIKAMRKIHYLHELIRAEKDSKRAKTVTKREFFKYCKQS